MKTNTDSPESRELIVSLAKALDPLIWRTHRRVKEILLENPSITPRCKKIIQSEEFIWYLFGYVVSDRAMIKAKDTLRGDLWEEGEVEPILIGDIDNLETELIEREFLTRETNGNAESIVEHKGVMELTELQMNIHRPFYRLVNHRGGGTRNINPELYLVGA